jgi:ATP-dependent RNA helicase DDX56/DBP9
MQVEEEDEEDDSVSDFEEEDEEEEEEEDPESEEDEPSPPPAKKAKKGAKAPAAAEEPTPVKQKNKKGKKGKPAPEEDDMTGDEADPSGAKVEIIKAEPESQLGKKDKKSSSDAAYSLVRGVDLKDVSTVINADMPTTVRDYVHRVGRCARGGAAGTALSLCADEEESMLNRIIRSQALGKAASSPEAGLRELPMQMSDVERFRYRVEDMARGLTKRVISQYRMRELQLEALNSEKLQEYFEDHPEEKKALQKSQRALKERKSIRQHLRHVPFYLVPEQFAATTPVQQAVRDEAAKNGGKVSSAVKRKRYLQAKKADPLQSCEARSKGQSKRRLRFTREAMEAKEKRIDPKTANIEDLPPMSGRKIWKLRHGKTVRKKTDQFGERRRMTYGQKRRAGKFHN